jgi:hypothetical protein
MRIRNGSGFKGFGIPVFDIGKIAIEVKKPPRYFIEETLDKKE